MPDYKVTDPATGRTLTLTGDSPPTEQELEEIFKAAGPAPVERGSFSHPLTSVVQPEIEKIRSALQQVTAAKPGEETPVMRRSRTGALYPSTEGTVASSVKGAAAGAGAAALAQAEASTSPLGIVLESLPFLKKLLSARPAARVGADVPNVSGIGDTVPARPVPKGNLYPEPGPVEPPVVERYAPNRSGIDTTMQQMPTKKVPYARPAPVVPPRVPRQVAGKAPKLEDELTKVLNELRGEKPPAGTTPPEPGITTAGREGEFASSGRPAVTAERYAEMTAPRATSEVRAAEAFGQEIPAKGSVKATKFAEQTAGADKLDEYLTLKHGGEENIPAPKGNGTHKVLDEFADMMGKKGATIDEAFQAADKGDVEGAAKSIEERVKLSVNEVAQSLRRYYGSRKAGDMLYGRSAGKAAEDAMRTGAARQEGIRRLAPGPSQRPIVAQIADEKTRLQMLMDEGGGISPRLLGSVAGGAAGAAVGGTQGDTTEERVKNAVMGGVTGAIAVPLLAHAFASTTPKKLQSLLYTSVLSSPQSIIKAYLGGAGGAIGAATEKIVAGETEQGLTIIRRLFSAEHVRDMQQAFRSGGQLSGRAEAAPSIINRAFDAVNEPAIRAMEAGGVSREDAIRYTLSGVPTSPIGRDLLGVWSRYFPLRLATTLFPRVGVQILERGLERTPVGMLKLEGINEGVSAGGRAARAAMGTGAGLAAATQGDRVPDWAKPYLTALSGVYGLPVGVGFAVSKAQQLGKGPKAQLQAGTEEVARNLPFPQYGPAEVLNPESMAAMAVPNVLRDVARARDPYERDTRKELFGRAKAKIPGLRETLPVRGEIRNIAGESVNPPSTPFSRAFNPSPTQAAPFKNIPERVTNEIQRLGVKIDAPSFQKEIPVGNRKIAVPPDVEERARQESRKYVLPQVEKLLDNPTYQQADDVRKKRMLEATISRAETAGSQRSRAHVIKLLRDSGALRAARP